MNQDISDGPSKQAIQHLITSAIAEMQQRETECSKLFAEMMSDKQRNRIQRVERVFLQASQDLQRIYEESL